MSFAALNRKYSMLDQPMIYREDYVSIIEENVLPQNPTNRMSSWYRYLFPMRSMPAHWKNTLKQARGEPF